MLYFTAIDKEACWLKATEQWLVQHADITCRVCHGVRRDVPIPDIEVDWIDSDWFAAEFRLGIPVMHRRIADIIGWDIIHRDLSTARVVTTQFPGGEDWLAFRGKELVYERGTRLPGYRDCEGCGRRFYTAGGRYHILLNEPYRDLYEAHGHVLIISERIHARILAATGRPKPRLRSRKLEVLPEPLDGLGRF